MIPLKTLEEINIMDSVNCIVHDTLDLMESNIAEGITTQELDSIAENEIHRQGGKPSFKNYKGYPSTICISVNDEIVHGIPGKKEIKDRDVVSIDIGVTYRGFVGDAARTIIVGDVDKKIKKLVSETKRSLYLGIEQMKLGNRLYDISEAIFSVSSENKYGNVLNFCGHGVGRKMHEEPSVFNYVNIYIPNVRLQNGMVLALEPMFTLGSSRAVVQDDGWTAVTYDKSIAAHWELSIAIVDGLPKILGVE